MGNTFTKMLQKGMVLEDIAVKYLVKAYPGYCIIPTHDFKTSSGKGPRILRHKQPDVTLPDIMMVDPISKHMILVEVKRKKKPVLLPDHGMKRYAAVEAYKVKDYREAATFMDADLFFIIGIDSSKQLHMVADQTFHIHNFNNQYSRCDNCCIEITSQNKVDSY